MKDGMKEADEGMVFMWGTEKEAIDDRKLFVKNLGWLLSQTMEAVKECYLDDNDYVHVVMDRLTIDDDDEVLVNVKMDSYLAIVYDVVDALLH